MDVNSQNETNYHLSIFNMGPAKHQNAELSHELLSNGEKINLGKIEN